MKKAIKTIFCVVLLFALNTSSSLAFEKVNPNNGLNYKTKRLKEKVVLTLKFTGASKAKYYREILTKRLSELDFIVQNDEITFLETSSQRYESTAGQLTEMIIAKKLTEEVDETVKLFEEHQKAIENIRDNYEYGISEWRLIMNDYNSLGIYIEKLRNI